MAGMAAAPQQPLLCLPGPENWYKYDGDFRVHAKPIQLVQEGGQGRGTGWCVWDGAVVLARYMEAVSALEISQHTDCPLVNVAMNSPTRCIELGAGTGLAGLSAAQAFQVPTVLTDTSEVQAALQHNINLNPHLSSLVSAQVLDWHSPADFRKPRTKQHQSECSENSHQPFNRSSAERPAHHVHAEEIQVSLSEHVQCENNCFTNEPSQCSGDNLQMREEQALVGGNAKPELELIEGSSRLLVLAADCVWVEGLVHPFVEALKEVCALCDNSVVLFAHKERSRKVDDVMMHALQADFSIEEVPELPGERRGSISIMQLVLKQKARIGNSGDCAS